MSHDPELRTAVAPAGSLVLARRQHYSEFYGLAPLPESYGVVLGNCQAESLRMVMDAPEPVSYTHLTLPTTPYV